MRAVNDVYDPSGNFYKELSENFSKQITNEKSDTVKMDWFLTSTTTK